MRKEKGKVDSRFRGNDGGCASRREPQWVVPFLRALERTGVVRLAAADAGVDYSTAYQRRKRHAGFAQGWAEAKRNHAEAKQRAEADELEALRSGAPSTAFGGPPPPDKLGEDLTIANGQVKRVGPGRWGKRKEKIFFDELTATANARRAAAAVGLTKNAVLQRRRRHPLFAAKWDAAVRNARAGIALYAIEAANQTFDPDELDAETAEVLPKVTIDQAIKISQIDAAQSRREAEEAAREGPDVPTTDEGLAELQEKVLKKLKRLRQRELPKRLAEGWSYDAERDQLIPPGWKRDTGEPLTPDE